MINGVLAKNAKNAVEDREGNMNFNVKKAIEKLDEIKIKYTLSEEEKCFMSFIREILLAGHADEKMSELYSRICDESRMQNKRINDIESKIGGIKKFQYQELEQRIARLEGCVYKVLRPEVPMPVTNDPKADRDGNLEKTTKTQIPSSPSADYFIREAKCGHCGREWNAWFPNGIEKDANIECPHCGFMTASPVTEKPSECDPAFPMNCCSEPTQKDDKKECEHKCGVVLKSSWNETRHCAKCGKELNPAIRIDRKIYEALWMIARSQGYVSVKELDALNGKGGER